MLFRFAAPRAALRSAALRVALNTPRRAACLCAQLAGTEFAPALELLRLFAFGTLADYKGASGAAQAARGGACADTSRPLSLAAAAAASGALPALSPAQLLKLKQLTVASLAEETKARPSCANASRRRP